MIGNQNADAGVLQIADDPLQFQDLDGVDAGKWLVQQEETRFQNQ